MPLMLVSILLFTNILGIIARVFSSHPKKFQKHFLAYEGISDVSLKKNLQIQLLVDSFSLFLRLKKVVNLNL